MIVRDPEEFLALSSSERIPARSPATARAAFLVAPAGAALAAESATDNRYMDLARTPDPSRALVQHAELARRLGEELPVVTFSGDANPEAIVFATAVPVIAPTKLNNPAATTARRIGSTPVETTVATAFAASWKPLT